MSSQQPFSAPPLVGEVHHIHHLSDHFGRLYISDEYSDVILVVEKNRILKVVNTFFKRESVKVHMPINKKSRKFKTRT